MAGTRAPLLAERDTRGGMGGVDLGLLARLMPFSSRAPAGLRIAPAAAGRLGPERIPLDRPNLLLVHMPRATRVPDAPPAPAVSEQSTGGIILLLGAPASVRRSWHPPPLPGPSTRVSCVTSIGASCGCSLLTDRAAHSEEHSRSQPQEHVTSQCLAVTQSPGPPAPHLTSLLAR